MLGDTIRVLNSELPPNVKLVAVSKFHPSGMIRQAYEAGQRVFAESRPQELRQKVLELAGTCPDISWHFIGHLQTNKLKMVLPYVDLVQSVDSEHLLDAIQDWAHEHGRPVKVLLEMHVAAEETKQGFDEAELSGVLKRKVEENAYPDVCFCGLMGMATYTDDKAVVRKDFATLQRVFLRIRESFPGLESFRELSTGMSGDYPIAVEYGSTMVRIGTKIFGSRF